MANINQNRWGQSGKKPGTDILINLEPLLKFKIEMNLSKRKRNRGRLRGIGAINYSKTAM